MVFYTVSALIGLDTLGAFSANGEQALTWMVIAAITFLLPYGLLTAEIGSTFTQEGGMYEWCKLAAGRIYAALGAMLYWISNPLWVGGSLAVGAIAAIKLFWFGSLTYVFGGSTTVDAIVELVIALALINGRLDAAAAFAASQLDESFQIEAWGEDSEQAERRAALAAEMEAAVRFIALLRC